MTPETEPTHALEVRRRLAYTNPPHRALVRTLRRQGLRCYAMHEKDDDNPNGRWAFRLAGAGRKLVDEIGFYREEWEQHKDLIKWQLQDEWSRHEYEGLPYCKCGAVDDTARGILIARGEPVPQEAWVHQCLTCHPEIEEQLYPSERTE